MKWIFIIVACFTLQDVRNEGCRVACVRDGYSSGAFRKSACSCVDDKLSYNGYINRSMNLGEPPIAPFIPEAKQAGKLVIEFPTSEY